MGLRTFPRPVAVVAGANGLLGAAHVGVGYALEQHGFVPDMVVGTSVGALNGAIAAAHPARAAPWLDHVWTQLRRRAGAIAARAGLLLLHHQIDRDLHEVSKHIPTVVLPTGVEAWPAPWGFRQSQRLISTAALTAGRLLDGLRISGPGLYRVNDASAASASPGEASTSSISGAGL